MSFGNYHAAFAGAATVTGTYQYFFGDFDGAELICMKLDASEAEKMPDGQTQFCMKDVEKFKSMFGPLGSQGTATVLISDYDVNFIAESDGAYFGAKLVNVVNVSGTTLIDK